MKRKRVLIPVTESKSKEHLLKDTQKIISTYHSLNKRLSLANKTTNLKEIENIKILLDNMGGLNTYQRASLKGGDIKKGFGASGVWLIPFLRLEFTKKELESANYRLRLLDVGAITGEVYVKYSKFLDVTSIDLNTQSARVLKQVT
jgi:25S rRNA (adenine2142-N1)-methyltransferase